MDEAMWESILAAYRNGATADFLWMSADPTGDAWGPIWTMPPGSVAAAERAALQIARMRARRLRHARCAQLRQPRQDVTIVVVVTILPDRVQQIRAMATGEWYETPWLEDEILALLRAALI